MHALNLYQQPTVLVDGDTWFRKPASELFCRVGPGETVMHIREGSISEIRSPLMNSMSRLLGENAFNLNGKEVSIAASSDMWNAGVVGLHPDNAGLLEDVLALTDSLCERSDLHVLEQFAFSWLLSHRTNLREAADVVFHYWPPYLHQPFRAKLPEICEQSRDLSECDRPEFLYAHRPRPTFARRSKVVIKRIAQRLGLVRGYCRTNEW